MTDLGLVFVWLGVLAAGLVTVVVARRLGLATTYARDLLHVGAGVWVVGWPLWQRPAAAIAIVLSALGFTVAVPWLARRVTVFARFRDSVSGGDERYLGVSFYVVSFAVLTTVGLLLRPFPAAAGLFALSWGDGLGGFAGRRFGKLGYRTPWGKRKTLVGSVVVALASGLGALLAAHLFDTTLRVTSFVVVGIVAAVAEAMAPKTGDNLVVPAVVWCAAEVLS